MRPQPKLTTPGQTVLLQPLYFGSTCINKRKQLTAPKHPFFKWSWPNANYNACGSRPLHTEPNTTRSTRQSLLGKGGRSPCVYGFSDAASLPMQMRPIYNIQWPAKRVCTVLLSPLHHVPDMHAQATGSLVSLGDRDTQFLEQKNSHVRTWLHKIFHVTGL